MGVEQFRPQEKICASDYVKPLPDGGFQSHYTAGELFDLGLGRLVRNHINGKYRLVIAQSEHYTPGELSAKQTWRKNLENEIPADQIEGAYFWDGQISSDNKKPLTSKITYDEATPRRQFWGILARFGLAGAVLTTLSQITACSSQPQDRPEIVQPPVTPTRVKMNVTPTPTVKIDKIVPQTPQSQSSNLSVGIEATPTTDELEQNNVGLISKLLTFIGAPAESSRIIFADFGARLQASTKGFGETLGVLKTPKGDISIKLDKTGEPAGENQTLTKDIRLPKKIELSKIDCGNGRVLVVYGETNYINNIVQGGYAVALRNFVLEYFSDSTATTNVLHILLTPYRVIHPILMVDQNGDVLGEFGSTLNSETVKGIGHTHSVKNNYGKHLRTDIVIRPGLLPLVADSYGVPQINAFREVMANEAANLYGFQQMTLAEIRAGINNEAFSTVCGLLAMIKRTMADKFLGGKTAHDVMGKFFLEETSRLMESVKAEHQEEIAFKPKHVWNIATV